jgi:galactokinase
MLAGRRVQSRVLADLAYEAEHDEVGVRCGRMDPVVAALARPGVALFLETRTGQISELNLPGHVTVLETGVTHRLAQGELNQRRKQCEEALAMLGEQGLPATSLAEISPAELPRLERVLPRPWFQRARHVITETARTRAAARALAMRDLVTLGGLLYEGHASLRDDYQSTCPEADLIVDAARRSGALGARLTGAGWGGAVVLLAPTVHEARIVAEVGDRFRLEFGRFPDLWTSKAAGGVRSDK